MSDLVSVAVVLAGISGVAGLGAWALARPPMRLVWRQIRFPGVVTAGHVQALLDVVAGLRAGPVVLVVESGPEGVRFLLGASGSPLGAITQALSGLMPQLRLDPTAPPRTDGFTLSGRVSWSGSWPVLRSAPPELAVASLLGALTGLGAAERLRLTLSLNPAGRLPSPTPSRRTGNAGGGLPPEHARAVRTKSAESLLRVRITVATAALPPVRARQLLERVVAVLRTRSGLRGRLRVRWLGRAATAKALDPCRRSFTGGRGTLLTSAETVPLTGWPIDTPIIAGVSYGVGPRLLPTASIPDQGRVFGHSTWPGQQRRRLAQPVIGGLQHTAVIGGTGSGKSTLVASLIEQDMAAGRGCLVVDAKGDLVSDLLARIPERRQRDVILLDPAIDGPQPGLRLFSRHRDVELTADLVITTLREIWPDTFGVRSAQFFRMGLATLGRTPDASLVDLPILFTDPAFRRRALRRVKDPLLRAAWQRFEALSVADQAAQLASPLSKLEEITGRARLRVVLGQRQPRLHFGEVLARGRIVLVRLPPGLIGQPAVRLLAAVTLWQFFAAVEARAALAPYQRPVFNAYVDEVAALGSVGLPLGDLLERARGLGVGLTLAPQSLSQLSPHLRASLMANVGSLAVFRLSASEAAALASELPGVSAEQLQHLDRFEIALRLALGPGQLSSTMTALTPPPSAPSSDAEVIRRLAGENWGATIEQVDQALAERLSLPPSDGGGNDEQDHGPVPVGSKRRSS